MSFLFRNILLHLINMVFYGSVITKYQKVLLILIGVPPGFKMPSPCLTGEFDVWCIRHIQIY